MINYSDFLEAQTIITKERIKKAFRYFDNDRSGEITIENILEWASRTGQAIGYGEARKMLDECKCSQNRKLSYEEFENLLISPICASKS